MRTGEWEQRGLLVGSQSPSHAQPGAGQLGGPGIGHLPGDGLVSRWEVTHGLGSGSGCAEPVVKLRCGAVDQAEAKQQGFCQGAALVGRDQPQLGFFSSPLLRDTRRRGQPKLCCLSVHPEPGQPNLYEGHALGTRMQQSNIAFKSCNTEATLKKLYNL